jgi:hypothetical protein
MSRTYSLACNTCSTRLWVGQGNDADAFYLYTTPEATAALTSFLRDHRGHALVFADDQSAPVDEYAEANLSAADISEPGVYWCSHSLPIDFSWDTDPQLRPGWEIVQFSKIGGLERMGFELMGTDGWAIDLERIPAYVRFVGPLVAPKD